MMRCSPRVVFRACVSYAFVGLSLVVLVGCGAGLGGRQPVSGTVTFQGAPLARGTIEFSPLEKSEATVEGGEIRDGKYSLPAQKGLMPGKYRVRISAAEGQQAPAADEAPGAPKPAAKELIPPQYNVNTQLNAEVTKKGPNNFPFDLK